MLSPSFRAMSALIDDGAGGPGGPARPRVASARPRDLPGAGHLQAFPRMSPGCALGSVGAARADLQLVVVVLGLGDGVARIGAGLEGVLTLLQRDVVEADLALLARAEAIHRR